MTRYAPPSPPMIRARWHGGAQIPRLIVMHSTVSPCKPGQARATAKYFAGLPATRKASAHYCVDPAEVIQCVGDHTVAYHCGYNQDSLGIELCEYPSWDKTRWDDQPHRQMEILAARLVAELCLAYDIRPRFVGRLGLLAGRRGVTTHRAMSKAFKRSTHWDPGAWRRRRFMRRVRRQIKRIKAETR